MIQGTTRDKSYLCDGLFVFRVGNEAIPSAGDRSAHPRAYRFVPCRVRLAPESFSPSCTGFYVAFAEYHAASCTGSGAVWR